MHSKSLSITYTKDDAQILIDEIELLEAAMFRGEGEFAKTLSSSVRQEVAQIFSDEQKGDWRKYLKELKDQVMNLNTMELTVATNLPRKYIEEIATHAKSLFMDDLVLDFRVIREVLGGAEISFRGKFKDYSLNNQISKWFAKGASK